jgi:titin
MSTGTLSLAQVTATTVQLEWEDRSENESGFQIEYSVGGKGWKLAGSVPADHSAVRVTGLVAGQKYQFRVSAYNEVGFSSVSNAAAVKASKALAKRGLLAGETPAPIVLDIRKVKTTFSGLTKSLTPDAATDLVATPYSTSAVQLTWTDNSETELGFRVEYSLNGRVWLLAGYVGADQTGCRVTGLQKGKAYTFRVSAYNLAGVTTKSATAKAGMPKVNPTGVAPSTEEDQDTVLNVLKVKAVAPGMPAGLKVA